MFLKCNRRRLLTYTRLYPIVLGWDFQFGLPAEIVAAAATARVLVQQRLWVEPFRVAAARVAVAVHVVVVAVCYTLGHHLGAVSLTIFLCRTALTHSPSTANSNLITTHTLVVFDLGRNGEK